jgi:hypothetical protein
VRHAQVFMGITDAASVRYDLRQKKELSIKHIIPPGMTEGSISIGEI